MNDLDELMSKDPLSLSDQDIDSIIAYQRRHRANVEGGGKVRKDKGPGVSLGNLVQGLVGKVEPKVTRR